LFELIFVISGGGIGYEINKALLPRIRNLGNMLRELCTEQLQTLMALLVSGIQYTVSEVLGQRVDQNLYMTDLLERYGQSTEVRTNIIENLINFFSGIHGNRLSQITPQ